MDRRGSHQQFKQLVDALGCGRSGCCRSSSRQAVLHCPAHHDRHPSFSVSLRGGKLLVHCFAGCSQSNVIDALATQGLWRPRRG